MRKIKNLILITVGLLTCFGGIMTNLVSKAQEIKGTKQENGNSSFKINVEQGTACPNFDINSFTQASNSPFATQNGPQRPEVGDFNNDGIKDVVIGNFASGSVSYFQGTGNGNFSSAVNIDTGAGNTTTGIAINDFNNDGNQDFAAANGNARNIVIFLGDGAGNFSPAPGSPISGSLIGVSWNLATADFNQDGNADLAVAQFTNSIITLLGDGTGNFTAAPDPPFAVSTSFGIETGDINNDAIPDLVYVNGQSQLIRTLIGDGTGGYTASSATNRQGNDRSRNLRIADFNNDGNQDIIVDSVDNNFISLLLGNGTSNFSVTARIDVGFQTSGIEAADFNGDGNVDFIASRDNDLGAIVLRIGNGDGTFTDGGTLSGLSETGAFAIGDFNSDSSLDFVIALEDTDQIGVYLGQCSNNAPTQAVFDFDGDGRSDISTFRPSDRVWYLNQSTDGFAAFQFGLPSDQLAPADYDGDGKADVAIWRESEGNFYILNSSDGSVRIENFGLAGDKLTVGDWDNDGKADLSVYREGPQSNFYYRGSNNNPNGNISYLPWGTTGDLPIRGDFDGDGTQDAAVFRPSDGVWYILQSSSSQVRFVNFGLAGDSLIPADYDGDSKTDLAVFRDGTWYVLQSTNNQIRYESFGITGDTLVPADYDGDGNTDIAVVRDQIWYIQQSSNSSISYANFGLSGDKPIPNAFMNQ